jgi:hypothetical protein
MSPSEVWWRALGRTVFRRLEVRARRLDVPVDASPPEGVVFGEVTDVDEYRSLRSETPVAEVERRFAAGFRCAAARHEGRLIGVRWSSYAVAELHYLDLAFALEDGYSYGFDALVHPAWRRRGVYVPLALWSGGLDEQAHTRLSAVWPENTPAKRMLDALGSEPLGWVGCWRIAGRRREVRRLPDAVLGAARALPR